MNRLLDCRTVPPAAARLAALQLVRPAGAQAAARRGGAPERGLVVGHVEGGATARAPTPPPLPPKPEPEEEQGGGQKRKGKGFRYNRSAGQKDAMIYLLGAAVVATPLLSLAGKARVDAPGFRESMNATFPPAVASTIINLAGAAASTPPPTAPPPAPAPAQKDTMALPLGLDKEVDADIVALAQRAVEEQRAAIDAASEAVRAQLAAEAQEEQARRAEVEARLAKELTALELEAAELRAENSAARARLEGGAMRVEAPQVIFQEVHLADTLEKAMSEEEAKMTAERIVTHLVARGAADVKKALADAVPVADEAALEAGTGLGVVQERVTELLRELEARSRLEVLRLREAVRHAEDETRQQSMVTMHQQLADQERELQRLIDIQVSEINRATKDALTNRQAQYADTIRREWDIVNERGEAFASLASRVDSARDAVRMEQLLSRDRQQLAQAFAWKANGRIASVEDLRLRLQAADKLLTEDKRRADQALLFEQLHLAVAAASEALDASEGSPSLAARLAPLQALTAADECVGAALASIPEDVLRRGVPALQDLAASFEPAAASARVRLLVPEGGGLAWEAYARLASLANRPLKDEVPPEGSSGEVLLRRARCHLKAGEVGEAVQELSKLPIGAQRAVEGWVAEARRRLVVRQALLLVGAHADAVMASLL